MATTSFDNGHDLALAPGGGLVLGAYQGSAGGGAAA